MNNPRGMGLNVAPAYGLAQPWWPSAQGVPPRITGRRAIARRAQRRMAVTSMQAEGGEMTTLQVEGGDDDFRVTLSRLERFEELPELRKSVVELERLLSDAIAREDYTAAGRLRDEVRDLRSKDPEVLTSSVSAQLQAAVKGERYQEAAKYRDQLRVLGRFRPEYQLGGSWKVGQGAAVDGLLGEWVQDGTVLRLVYDGDRLTATGGDGETIFTADASRRVDPEDSIGPSVEMLRAAGPENMDELNILFSGEGRVVGGDFVPGQMYLLDAKFAKVIGFWWGEGEEGRPAAVRSRGDQLDLQDGKFKWAFIIFRKVGKDNEENGQIKVRERLSNLYDSADGQQ